MTKYTMKFLLTLSPLGIFIISFLALTNPSNSSIDELQMNLIADELITEPSKVMVKFDPIERKSFVTYNNNEYIFQYDSESNDSNLMLIK